MNSEIWADVKGYNGKYQVSTLGNVRSYMRCKNNSPKIIKGEIIQGYRRVILRKNNIGKSFSVHRLVAECFVDNPNNKPEVNHVDGDKLNNVYTNLDWVSRSENMMHAVDVLNGKFGKYNRLKPVMCVETGAVYRDASLAAASVGCSRSLIHRVANPNDRAKTAKGSHWKYV